MKRGLWAILSVLASLTVGIVGAILLAPRSGRETRALLRERAGDLGGKAVEGAQTGWSRGRMRVTELIQTGQDAAETLLDKAKQARGTGKLQELGENLGEQAQHKAKEATKRARELRERLGDS